MTPGDHFNPYKQFAGLWIPLWLGERQEISGGGKLLYSALALRAGEDGKCFPGQASLATAIGVGGCGESKERTVRRYLTELVEWKLLKVEQRGLHLTNFYYFLWHPWMDGHTRKDSALDRTNLSGQERPEKSGQERPNLSGEVNKGEREKENQKEKTPPYQNRPADAGPPAAACGATAMALAVSGVGGGCVEDLNTEEKEHLAAARWQQQAKGKPICNEGAWRATLLKRWRSVGFNSRDLQTLATWRAATMDIEENEVSNADLVAAAGDMNVMPMGKAWRLFQVMKREKCAARGES